MQSTVESVEGNKVKLHITVPADEFERAIDAAFRKLAREVRIPGFRPGKAPRRLLEARLGTDIAREQALRDSLPEYYVDAVTEHDVDVIAPPEIEITAGQEDGDVEFDAVVEVRPQVHLIGYDELRVELPFEPVGDDDVDEQVDALRDRFADLTDSEYPLIDDAYATIDIAGSIDGEAGRGPHRHRLPVPRRLRHGRARARRAAARHAARRDPRVHRDAARTLRRARRRRRDVPRAS